jgi:4-oxalocrotonate tautomerase
MPVITIEAGQLNREQKRDLVVTLTKEAASIMKVEEQAIIVLIKEISRDNIGFGGVWLGEKS